MKKLCVFTLYDEKGASSRYRILMYKEELEKRFQVKLFHFWSNAYITKYTFHKKKYRLLIALEYIRNVLMRLYQLYVTAPECDVVFIQKDVIPGIKKTFLEHLRKKGIRIVYDVDDAYYLSSRHNTDEIAKVSSAVICGNGMLKEHYSRINDRCVIIPTVENTRMFRPYWKDTFDDKIIGWIGSGVTLHNLDLVVDAVNQLVSRHPEVRFHIICNTPGDYLEKIRNAVFVKWELKTYISEMGKFTIGIMPLKDIPINRGKCGFKLIQSLNMRKPVVATDLGVNREIVGGCGLLAQTTEEWAASMEKLLFSRKDYDACVSAADKEFFEKYNYDRIFSQIAGVIDAED